MVICLERGTELHTAQLMPCHCHSLSLASVNPDWFYLSGTGSPGLSRKRAVKRVCVCVRACVCVLRHIFLSCVLKFPRPFVFFGLCVIYAYVQIVTFRQLDRTDYE